jgi:hypothetical protein
MEGHMMRSILIVAAVAVLGGAASLILGHTGADMKGTFQNDVGATVSSRGATVTVDAQLPGALPTMVVLEATVAPAAGDSRLDNYRLERDSCCVGNY